MILILISFFIKYPDLVSSKILITTQNPVEKIEAKVDGKLKILIQNKENVSEGQILGYLETRANYQDIMKLKNILDSFKPNSSQFDFPINQIRDLDLGELKVSYIHFEKVYSNYTKQSELQNYSIEKAEENQVLSDIEKKLKDLEAQKRVQKDKLQIERNNYDKSQRLFKLDSISANELEIKRLTYLKSKNSYQNIDSSILLLLEIHRNIQNEYQRENTIKKQWKNEPYIHISQAYENFKKAFKEWQQNFLLISSTDGKVVFQKNWKNNQLVASGEVIFMIIPKNRDKVLGKLVVSAKNLKKIDLNQKVLIKLDNYEFHKYGIIEGNIQSISSLPDSNGNYHIEIKLPNELITSNNKQLNFDNEMYGSAEIVTKESRLFERLFYQFKELF